MSAATIVFLDIVGFSNKPTAEQRTLVNSLTSEIAHELRPLLSPPMGTASVLAMPTGDGMALAFTHSHKQPWDRSTVFELLLRIQKWSHEESENHGEVSLRVGVHVGPVELLTDINGKPNICGETINYGQRIMDAGNPRQVLFSEVAFREYIGSETSCFDTHPFSEELRCRFEGPIEIGCGSSMTT